jgi:hypothetical protein
MAKTSGRTEADRNDAKATAEKRDYYSHHPSKPNGNGSKVRTELALNPIHPKPGSDTVQVLLGTPTLGTVRIEWYNAMVGMVTPPNWALVRSVPMGYTVPDAQNMIVDSMLRGSFRALMLIEDDTCPPAETILTFDRWFWKMERKKAPPIVSGLYHIKGSGEMRKGKKGRHRAARTRAPCVSRLRHPRVSRLEIWRRDLGQWCPDRRPAHSSRDPRSVVARTRRRDVHVTRLSISTEEDFHCTCARVG